jgi:ABC-type transport system involved in multi-copper enzyme maturation permease subunit
MGGRGLGRVAAVAHNTFRESVRERVLYNIVIFAVLMTAAGFLLGELSVRQDEKIIKDIGLASIDIFGTLIALFVGVALVNKEIERRSLMPIMAKPVSRTEFLLGKLLGLALTLFVNVAVMTLGVYLTLLATGRGLDPQLLKAVFALYLGLLLVVAIALLFSTLASSTVAAICTVCAVAAGRFSDVVRDIPTVAPAVPRWLARTLYLVLPNFRNFDIKNHVVYGDPVSMLDLGGIALYGLVYGAIVFGLALTAFRKRDFV